MAVQSMRAILPLSGDPITNGHLWLIREASTRYDHLSVVVLNNGQKQHLLPLRERALIVAKHIGGLSNVSVSASRSALADVFMRERCGVVVRGQRDDKDAAEDAADMAIHKWLCPWMRWEHISSPEEYQKVSSSLVKALVMADVDVSPFVPVYVKRLLEFRLRGIQKVGLGPGVSRDVLPCKNTEIDFKKLQLDVDCSPQEAPYHYARLCRTLLRDAHPMVVFPLDDLQNTQYVNHTVILAPGTDASVVEERIAQNHCGQVIFSDQTDVIQALCVAKW